MDAHRFYIGGEWVAPLGHEQVEVRNPADHSLIGIATLGNAFDADHAVAAARRAFESWRFSGIDERLDLLRRMRVQANFAEYVPFALLLMALAESLGTRPWLLHALGVVLLLARVSHAFGMSQPAETMAFRSAGVAGTFGVLLIAAAACVVNALG